MMNELISIIMPAYNMENYIGKTIESVLKQKYTKWELIIINDGSNDNTKQIVKQYQCKDKRIKYLEQENKGVSVARNKGIDSANGKYISFLDADDLWEPIALSELINVAKKTDAGWICGEMDIIKPSGNKERFNQCCKDGNLLDFVTPCGECRLFFGVGAYIIRKDILNKYNIRFEESIRNGEDLCLYIKLFTVTDLKSVPIVVAHYCQHKNSATLSGFDEYKLWDLVKIFSLAKPYIHKYRPEWGERYQQMEDYYAYRFVWSIIKRGMYHHGLMYIDIYEENLKRFCYSGHKINDRLKAKCFLTKNMFLLRLLTGFKMEN